MLKNGKRKWLAHSEQKLESPKNTKQEELFRPVKTLKRIAGVWQQTSSSE